MFFRALAVVGIITSLSVGSSSELPPPHAPLATKIDQPKESNKEILVEKNQEDLDTEAEEISSNLADLEANDNIPVLAGYDTRIIEESHPDEFNTVDSFAASFSLPKGCVRNVGTTLACDNKSIFLYAAVYSADGSILPNSIVVDKESFIVSIQNDPEPEMPIVFAVFVSDSESYHLIVETAETLRWMLDERNELMRPDEIEEQDKHLTDVEHSDEFIEDSRNSASNAWRYSTEIAVNRDYNEGATSVVPAAYRPAMVKVPSSYRYCPKTCKPKRLHDYCSYVPDYFRHASFRGPCARHDMSIDKIRKRNIPLSKKRAQRAVADATLKKNMRQNCAYAFYRKAERSDRGTCYSRASTYHVGVTIGTATWNGK